MVSESRADVVVFDFRTNGGAGGALGADLTGTGTDFDTSAIGDTVAVPNVAGTGTLTATLLELTAPEFAGGLATGNILTASGGANIVTNVSGQDALGINNPSIGNNAAPINGPESSDLNVGESFTFSFDQAVVFTQIELESVVATDGFEVLVDGVSFLNRVGDDSFLESLDGLAGLTIDAGSAITFSASAGDLATSSFRIETFTVETIAVPEPTSLLALVGMAGLFAVSRRR